jgi:HEAT repeat protein
MMIVDDASVAVADDPAAVIARLLREGDELIRCAAARALGALGDSEAASSLVEALLDEDPDVRTDAMEALTGCARPEDAEAIRRSLEGDPVKEVKVFAIEALVRLQDQSAIPLLRALSKDRAEGDVAWEDEAGMWDDWLDVQVATIKALGRMQVSEAIEDLLDARTDEMGQELDIVVFAALAEIEEGGLSALFGLLRDRDARVRERVLRALAQARPEAMLPMQAILLRDANPAIRRLAIPSLDPNHQAVADLVLSDPDARVRTTALSVFASARPDLAMAALQDPEEAVIAVAVQSLPMSLEAPEADDLAANLQAWMETAGALLAAAAAKALPSFANRQADEALRHLATNTDRPVEARMAALQALGELSSEVVIKALGDNVEDPIRQIRTVALASLSAIAGRQDDRYQAAAEALLAAAIRGDLGTNMSVAASDEPAGTDDVAASKVEGGPGRITISPDGEIVTSDETADNDVAAGDNIIQGAFPTSTLGAIQMVSAPETLSGDAERLQPSGQGPRRRRVAVDGPDDFKQDIRVVALGMIGACPGQQVEQALLEALDSGDPSVRRAAFKAVAQRSATESCSQTMIDACKTGLADADAAIRSYAATFISNNAADASDLLSMHVDNPDPVFRAAALRAVTKTCPEKALGGLRDPSALVRRTAMQLLIASTDDIALKQGVDICLMEERSDILKEACQHCSEIRKRLLAAIGKNALAHRQLRVALETLASV